MPKLPPFFTHLKLRTENSFRVAAGKLPAVLDCVAGTTHAGIADRSGTWGHVRWSKECKSRGIIPIFGAEIAVVPDMEVKEKQHTNFMTFLARNDQGLAELYQLLTLATEKFYYLPRLDYGHLNEVSNNILILAGANPLWSKLPKKQKNIRAELGPLSDIETPAMAKVLGYPLVAVCDNLYPTPRDYRMYEMVMGDLRQSSTTSRHILAPWEWIQYWPGQEQALHNAAKEALTLSANLPKAHIISPREVLGINGKTYRVDKQTLKTLCQAGFLYRKIKPRANYSLRLARELELIAAKKFEDYFYVVTDMIAWAKQHMMVGPARGSSCGSLVCYLLGITDIDPMPFDLLFERFIDLNREDYPDIDIDFQDDKRELVFEYLRKRYGPDNVARLGTFNLFKAKSALGDVAKHLSIPKWEIDDLISAIPERSTGDARAQFCIMDTLEQLDVGKAALLKYPEIAVAAEIEGHIRHSGMHAAGILVTEKAVTNYCSINTQTGTAMLDKKDAEKLDLLKIDALGLRTLAVMADTLEQIGWTHAQLLAHPLNDKKAFAILNDYKFAGIFQFEGYALQSLTRQMTIQKFEDVAVLTALARPGPIDSGGASEFIRREMGKSKVEYIHPLMRPMTEITHGIVVYQEQVMRIVREIGALSWEDTSELRKAMSKSMGEEFFDKYWEKFFAGAKAKHKLPEDKAREIWKTVNTMGSWAFNRSHAVAYGMISYWCCILKAHFPLQFSAACLRNAKDDEQSIHILRELVLEGYKYKPYDAKLSGVNWSVQKGQLVGGLIGIKGIGPKLAESIVRKRDGGEKLTPREVRLLQEGVTPWDKVFECAESWGYIVRNPGKYGIESALCTVDSITEESSGTFVFIAKIGAKSLRDHNEEKLIAKRGGRKTSGQTVYLNMTLEDDTGSILSGVNRHRYETWGKPLVEDGKVGDWYIFKGENRAGFRKVHIFRWRKLTGVQEFMKKSENKQK